MTITEANRLGATAEGLPGVQLLRRLTLARFDGVGLTASPPAWLEESLFAMVPAMPPDVSLKSAARALWLDARTSEDSAACPSTLAGQRGVGAQVPQGLRIGCHDSAPSSRDLASIAASRAARSQMIVEVVVRRTKRMRVQR